MLDRCPVVATEIQHDAKTEYELQRFHASAANDAQEARNKITECEAVANRLMQGEVLRKAGHKYMLAWGDYSEDSRFDTAEANFAKLDIADLRKRIDDARSSDDMARYAAINQLAAAVDRAAAIHEIMFADCLEQAAHYLGYTLSHLNEIIDFAEAA